MGYSISEISKAVGAEAYSFQRSQESPQPLVSKAENGGTVIEKLLIDSRNLIHPRSTLFVCIASAKNDGHRYIEELYRKGVTVFLVNRAWAEGIGNLKNRNTNGTPSGNADFASFGGAVFLVVQDTLAALQNLAAWHRSQFNIPVVGITGSNGKTIVKEWLYQLLSDDKNIVRSPGSYNSQVGVPLSVWAIDQSHNFAIFEAGISLPGEMENLEKIIKPSIGIFTNIGEAHGLNFHDVRQKVKEKLKLFLGAQTLIYCKDHKEIDQAVRADSTLASVLPVTWSKEKGADFWIKEIKTIETGTQVKAISQSGDKSELSYFIPFKDEASVENSIHCFVFMHHQGYSAATIQERMNCLMPIAMRLEMIKGVNRCTIINDVYNSDINSLAVALEFLNRQKQHERKTVILSDIVQSGGTEQELYRKVAEIINANNPTRLIAVGKAIAGYSGLFNCEKHFFDTTEELIARINEFAFHDEAILVKGARKFEFERISRLLQYKTHETALLINLNSLIHNLNYFRSITRPSAKIMAMVKAFSYGSGSFEIANALQYHGTDYLAVAYADEGVELRTAGITLPIMVMNPEQESMDTMLRNRLEPEIYNFRTLGFIIAAMKRNSPVHALPVHIKLDTGMHRLGFGESDMARLNAVLKENPFVKVKSVFSHLAGSDADEHKEFTLQQISRFEGMSEKIIQNIGYPVMRHILNSAGIVRYPAAHFDMVRLGIGLYGVGANEQEQKKLENVSTLKSAISQINRLKKGETVGYNRRATLARDSVIATVSIGYADGYGRELGNGRGRMRVHGIQAPVVGDVCMDMCMIDITGIDATEGDEVIIFDSIPTLKQVAKDMNTIPYEVLTSLSPRVKRVYVQE